MEVTLITPGLSESVLFESIALVSVQMVVAMMMFYYLFTEN